MAGTVPSPTLTPELCLGTSVGWHSPKPPLDPFKAVSAETIKSQGPDHSWRVVTERDTALEEDMEERWGTGSEAVIAAAVPSCISVRGQSICPTYKHFSPICGLPGTAARLAMAVVLLSRVTQLLKYRCNSSYNLAIRSVTASSTIHNWYLYGNTCRRNILKNLIPLKTWLQIQ